MGIFYAQTSNVKSIYITTEAEPCVINEKTKWGLLSYHELIEGTNYERESKLHHQRPKAGALHGFCMVLILIV